MKSFKQIQREAGKGDYSQVATIAGTSASTVKMVVYGHRNDLHNIQKIFSDMLEQRERMAEREEKRRIRKAEREAKRLAA